jgi:hypothetical protein
LTGNDERSKWEFVAKTNAFWLLSLLLLLTSAAVPVFAPRGGFLNTTFLDELKKNGFFDKLYK